MKVGRKTNLDPPVEWKISLPSTLAAAVELKLLDPVTHNVRYGSRSKLLAQLLGEWLQGKQEPPQ